MNMSNGGKTEPNQVLQTSGERFEDHEKENGNKCNLLSSMKVTKSRITSTPVKSVAEPSSAVNVSQEDTNRASVPANSSG